MYKRVTMTDDNSNSQIRYGITQAWTAINNGRTLVPTTAATGTGETATLTADGYFEIAGKQVKKEYVYIGAAAAALFLLSQGKKKK